MFLRADPAGTDGSVTCHVYSSEINTQEKLRELISRSLGHDLTRDPIQSTTLQRMIQEYLTKRNARISLSQSDHNACPPCKTMRYALLSFSFEVKELERTT